MSYPSSFSHQATGSTPPIAPPRPDADLSAEERRMLANVAPSLASGIELMNWWKKADANGSISDKFELTTVFNRPESGYSFFDTANLANGPLPVMGDVPELFYDQPKAGRDLGTWTEEVRKYVLRYFMRISDFREPQVVSEDVRKPPAILPELSFCPKGLVTREGFGYSQLYYKKRGTGEIGRFPKAEQDAIIDVRKLETEFEWIVASVRIFNFVLSVPLTPQEGFPFVGFSLPETAYVVLSDAFVTDELAPSPGTRGRFSFGYVMLDGTDPDAILAFGPGQFKAGFQLFTWEVSDSGKIRVRMPFVVDRPTQILRISANPLNWGIRAAELATFGLANPVLEPLRKALNSLPFGRLTIDPVFGSIDLINLMTLGQAARQYCISKEDLEKFFLVFHFEQYYTMLTGSLLTWRQIKNWLDAKALPDWVRTGRSA